jgi:hypothetical protein
MLTHSVVHCLLCLRRTGIIVQNARLIVLMNCAHALIMTEFFSWPDFLHTDRDER